MKKVEYDYTRQSLFSGFDGKFCKICPSVCSDGKTILMMYSHLLLTGSDVVYGQYTVRSTDGGKTYSEPLYQDALSDVYEGDVRRTFGGNLYYNKHHRKWLMIGLTSMYRDDKLPVCVGGISVTAPIWGEVDPEKGAVVNHRPMAFPVEYASAYCMGQIVEFENGDMLLPFNFTTPDNPKSMVMTVRYTFEDGDLKPVKWGQPIFSRQSARGCGEPSLARLHGKYYVTLRTDEMGLYAESDDGYHFSEPKPWRWDDGSILENYNTQQHWMVNRDGLFLAYTRKGAHNDHVFRHRAPIFMTRFDEERGCLIREEEIILVPELGARLGNFYAVEPNDREAWLMTAEWMQSWDGRLGVCEKYGSNNSLWLAKVFWKD